MSTPDLGDFLNRTVTDYVLLGVFSSTEAQRMAGHLRDRGVELQLVFNPQTCSQGTCSKTGSCSTSSEVWAQQGDLEAVKAFLHQESQRVYGDLEFDQAALNQVFDPEQPEAVCPACATTFATTSAECPECGLSFGGNI